MFWRLEGGEWFRAWFEISQDPLETGRLCYVRALNATLPSRGPLKGSRLCGAILHLHALDGTGGELCVALPIAGQDYRSDRIATFLHSLGIDVGQRVGSDPMKNHT